jgi:hypothetical protein
MYTFQPIHDYSDSHAVFYTLAIFVILFLGGIIALWKNDDIETGTLLGWVVIFSLVLFVSHDNSYTPNHPKNELHVGHFVRYETEGYRERSGKTTADRHYVYVVYNIDGADVLFEAGTGMAYPKDVNVYKN